MGRVGAGARHGEVDAAERQLLDVLGIVADLAAAVHLHLVATVGVLLDLFRKEKSSGLARALLLVGVAELQHGLGARIQRAENHDSHQDAENFGPR